MPPLFICQPTITIFGRRKGKALSDVCVEDTEYFDVRNILKFSILSAAVQILKSCLPLCSCGVQFKSERSEMSLKLSSVLFLVLCFSLFCCEFVQSKDSSRPGDTIISKETYDVGRESINNMILAPWVRRLKQILPANLTALAAVPAYVESSNMDSNYSLILAENRTKRPDILSKFRQYRGGWNITNKHYWASVSFTGAPGFVLGILWFTAFGFAFFALCFFCKSFKGEQEELQLSYWVLLPLILFTCAAITGCILLSLGQDKIHYEISHTLNFVVKQSEFVVENLRNVTRYLADAETVSVAQIVIPANEQKQIEQLNENLIVAANALEEKTTDNADKIKKALDAFRDALIVVAGVMLFLAILGFLLAILDFQHIIYGFVIIGWLLVTVTFILCGVFIALNNAITDTCTAMEEWVDHPNADTNLDHILPCINQSTSNQTLYRSKEVTGDLVNVTNEVIQKVANMYGGSTYYNQSGPQMPELCNPYDFQMNDRQCSPQQVNFTTAAQVWQPYICNVSNGICVTPGRVTPDIYLQLVTVVNLGYGLKHYTPFLLDLIDCKFVRETFSTIDHSYCPRLQQHSKWVYIGLALVSVGVMLSLIFWIIYIRQGHQKILRFEPARKMTVDKPSIELGSKEESPV